MANLAMAVGVPDLAALVALGGASAPPRVDGGIYWVSNAGGLGQGRWAQYLAGSTATVTEGAIMMPADGVGRWHLGLAAAGGAGGGEYDAPGGDGFDAATEAWIAAATGTYSDPELAAVNALVLYCKGASIAAGGVLWDAITGLTIASADNVADSGLDLKTATDSLILVNGPVFTAREGFKLNGTNQMIGTEIRPNNVLGFVGAYLRLNTGQGYGIICAANNTDFSSGLSLEHRNSGGDGIVSGFIAYSSAAEVVVPPSDWRGAQTASLTDASIIVASNQLATTEPRGSIDGNITARVFFGANQVDGDSAGGSISDNQFAAFWQGWGKGLTAAELQGFHAAIETCLDVFGAGVIG